MKIVEIKRKFLPKANVDVSKLKKVSCERYFIYSGEKAEIRVQRIDDKYELERLVKKSELSRDKQVWEISEQEFNVLKSLSKEKIIRDSYLISNNPEVKVRIYHGRFEGLTRIEVGFKNEDEAKRFTPFNWFGKEITNTTLWRDSELLKLSGNDFEKLLN